MSRAADDADHGHPGRVFRVERDPLPQRIETGHVLGREGFAHDDDGRRRRRVSSREAATSADWNAERVEISGRDRADPRAVVRNRFAAGHAEVRLPFPVRERQCRRRHRRRHARQAVEARQQIRPEPLACLVGRIPRLRQRHRRGEQVIRPEARRLIHQEHEAAKQQAAAREQQQRQRHLGRDDRPAQPVPARPGQAPARRPAAVAEPVDEARGRCPPRRRQAEDDAGQHGERRSERQDGGTDRDGCRVGQQERRRMATSARTPQGRKPHADHRAGDESSTLSVNNCRMSRPREAPRRRANSNSRRRTRPARAAGWPRWRRR